MRFLKNKQAHKAPIFYGGGGELESNKIRGHDHRVLASTHKLIKANYKYGTTEQEIEYYIKAYGDNTASTIRHLK